MMYNDVTDMTDSIFWDKDILCMGSMYESVPISNEGLQSL